MSSISSLSDPNVSPKISGPADASLNGSWSVEDKRKSKKQPGIAPIPEGGPVGQEIQVVGGSSVKSNDKDPIKNATVADVKTSAEATNPIRRINPSKGSQTNLMTKLEYIVGEGGLKLDPKTLKLDDMERFCTRADVTGHGSKNKKQICDIIADLKDNPGEEEDVGGKKQEVVIVNRKRYTNVMFEDDILEKLCLCASKRLQSINLDHWLQDLNQIKKGVGTHVIPRIPAIRMVKFLVVILQIEPIISPFDSPLFHAIDMQQRHQLIVIIFGQERRRSNAIVKDDHLQIYDYGIFDYGIFDWCARRRFRL